jgi:hypothetical protein
VEPAGHRGSCGALLIRNETLTSLLRSRHCRLPGTPASSQRPVAGQSRVPKFTGERRADQGRGSGARSGVRAARYVRWVSEEKSKDLVQTAQKQALVDAMKALTPGPIQALTKLIGALLRRPELGGLALAALQDDVVRLYERIEAAISGLDAEVRGKIDPVEAVDLAAQTLSNMGRTAYAEKRELMARVLIHGLKHPEIAATERRLFVRAIADLDVAHVALLQRLHTFSVEYNTRSDSGNSFLAELVQRGFAVRVEKLSPNEKDKRNPIKVRVEHAQSKLGARFLKFLAENEDATGEPEPPPRAGRRLRKEP